MQHWSVHLVKIYTIDYRSYLEIPILQENCSRLSSSTPHLARSGLIHLRD